MVSNQRVFREGTAVLLRHHGFEIVSEHGTPSQLMMAVKKPPDVVLVDLDHAKDGTRAVVRNLKHNLPDTHVVSLGTPVRQGAVADEAPDVPTLVAAVNQRRPARSAELDRQHRLWAKVTPRQREVLGWLAVGSDNSAIAHELQVTRAR
ncbi:MAG: response regulator transcription factor [Deltaproteobacteria bacterium]|nr:response regulator transcription factor [Deltaproteobacteria bacterium]